MDVWMEKEIQTNRARRKEGETNNNTGTDGATNKPRFFIYFFFYFDKREQFFINICNGLVSSSIDKKMTIHAIIVK